MLLISPPNSGLYLLRRASTNFIYQDFSGISRTKDFPLGLSSCPYEPWQYNYSNSVGRSRSLSVGDVTEHFCRAGITPATSADTDDDFSTSVFASVDDALVTVDSLPEEVSKPQRKYGGCVVKTSGLSDGADDRDDR